MMDVENMMLANYDWRIADYKTGRDRANQPSWAAHVKQCLIEWYPEPSPTITYGGKTYPRKNARAEVTWEEYKAWVEAGGGDEYFFEDNED